MSWADDEDDIPCAAVPPFQPPSAVVTNQPRPSLLAQSLPDQRDSRDSRTPRAAPLPMPHSRAADSPKAKGHQGQRDDIARIQKNLSNTSGVSTLSDRMGANPWSKPATPAGPAAAAAVTPRHMQAAPEPQRKPLVLAPRTQPLPVFPVPSQAPIPLRHASAPAAAVSQPPPSTAEVDAPVTPKPSTPKSDPFGGARPVDVNKAAEIRRKLQEEKAQLEATRITEARLASEKAAKETPGDKDTARHQDERPSSARGGGWGGRGRSGERASSDTVEVKILQRSMEKVAITQPSSPAVVQTVDAPAAAARHVQAAHGSGGGGRGAKPATPRLDDTQLSAVAPAPVVRGAPQSPKLDATAAKGPPKSPNLGPAAAAVVTAAAAAADGTPSNRGKGKRKESGGKGRAPQGTDLPLPFDS